MIGSSRVRKPVLLFSVLLVIGFGVGEAGYAPFNEILRSNTDGTNVERILTRDRALATGYIEVDPDLGDSPVYWTVLDPFDPDPWGGYVPKIRRAGAYGHNIWNVAQWSFGPLSIDPVADKIYWVGKTDCEPCDSIGRANLDGSNREYIFGSDITVHALAVDPVGEKVYWQGTDYSYDERMWIIDLDGTNPQELFAAGPAYSLAVDAAAQKLYWVENDPWRIRRSNLDGSGAEDLLEVSAYAQLVLDPTGDRMWWTDASLGTVSRSNLDGSGVTQVLSGLDTPSGIAYMPADGSARDKIYFVANPGEVDVSVPAVSRAGAMALVLLLLTVATVFLLRRRAASNGRG